MKISSKGLAVAVLVVGGLIVAAYNFGNKQADSTTPSVAGVSQGQVPPNHPGGQGTPAVDLLPGQQANTAKFAHFRVGQRNVKGMLADGNEVWVGTSV